MNADNPLLLPRAAELLEADANDLRICHNADPDRPSWEDEPAAKAAHDEALAIAAGLRALAAANLPQQLATEKKRDAFPMAHRLALELECLLLSNKDTAAVSKWWDSAHEALEQWREFCREDTEEAGAGDTPLCWRCGREHDEAGYPKCACTGP